MEKDSDGNVCKSDGGGKPFLQVLKAKDASSLPSRPPVWLMRQAGRYLPEYRAVREKVGGFLDLCYSPKDAAEVTLQPIRRYGFDAAILFSDILVVPDALGQAVRFEQGEGPRLDPIEEPGDLSRLDLKAVNAKYSSIYESVERIREQLPDETALIGFCGAPFTVATYMIAGRGTPDQAPARIFAYAHPDDFQRLIDILVESSVEYLRGQIEAGAEAVQIFDSWASVLPEDEFEKWVLDPMLRIVRALRQYHPHIPIIGFPRAVGPLYERYARESGVDAIGCDTSLPLSYMREVLQPICAVQGNLDPILLQNGGSQLVERSKRIIASLAGGGHIFNLGHGILQHTPPENVARLMEVVRGEA
jgi:uroporphyrinogen decarboxylase